MVRFGPRRLALPFSKRIDMSVACNLVHPGGERSLRYVSLPKFQEAEEDILDKILAQLATAGQVVEEAEKLAMVPLEKYREFPDLAAADFQHEGFVPDALSRYRRRFSVAHEWDTHFRAKGYEVRRFSLQFTLCTFLYVEERKWVAQNWVCFAINRPAQTRFHASFAALNATIADGS
jgi:hypothetical protein